MEKIKYISIIGIIIIMLSCQIDFDQNSKIQIRCSFPSRALTVNDIKLAKLKVEGPGVETQVVETTSNVIEVEVEQGDNRKFTLDIEFNDGSHYQGVEVTDIKEDTKSVNILLYKAWLNDIIKFVFEADKNNSLDKDYDGLFDGNEIYVTLPQGISLKSLIPTIEHNGSKINKTGLQDFSNPVEYIVTALNGDQAKYNVYVSNEEVKDSRKEITSFKFLAEELNTSSTDIIGIISGTDITVDVPFGTDITLLTPEIVYSSKATIDITTAQNFTSDVVYRVTAENETYTDYTVTVTVLADPRETGKEITSFKFLADDLKSSSDVFGIISGLNITVDVPFGTDVTSLTPEIVYTSTAKIDKNTAENFTSDVKYTVTAENESTAVYTVQVTVLPDTRDTAKEITSFKFIASELNTSSDNITGIISGSNIIVDVSFGTDVTSLTPEIVYSSKATIDKTTAQNFTSDVVYRVTAENETYTDYTVKVNVALNPAKEISDTYVLVSVDEITTANITGAIDGLDITYEVPFGSDITSLTPVFVHTGSSISPNTAQDFTTSKKYVVTAEDGTENTYTLTVNVLPNPSAKITSFKFFNAGNSDLSEDYIGTISGNSVSVVLPYGTTVTNLVPTIQHEGETITPNSSVAQDFSSSISYEVVAYAGKRVTYTVTVYEEPAVSLNITSNLDASVSYSYVSTNIDMLKTETKTLTINTGDVPIDMATWSIDGKVVGQGPGMTSISISGADYSIGSHSVSCVVLKGSELFNIPLIFRVNE